MFLESMRFFPILWTLTVLMIALLLINFFIKNREWKAFVVGAESGLLAGIIVIIVVFFFK